MNWTSMPPLSALRAFCAYTEAGSVTAAGAALNVSHAAISQQMRTLEAHMGVALLDRSGRSMALTPDGQALAYALQEGFGSIAETIEALSGSAEERPLQITCTPSFASNWLMPRLARFRAAHPDIDMMINPSPALTDPTRGGTDVALRFGTGPWPGLQSEFLMAAPLIVVGAPELFPDGPPADPAHLLNYPWLHELGNNETSAWLATRGVTDRHRGSVTEVPGNLMIDGARSAQGIAVTTRLAVEEDIASGRLLALFQDESDQGYHIVTRPGPLRTPLKDFVRWLRREVAKAE